MIHPGMKNPPYEIELSDNRSRRRYGLKVPQGSLQIGTISQDDTVYIRNVGKRVGDFDEQRSWKSGRGQDNFSDSAESYWDSENAWTLSPNHLHQGLQWYHARGLRREDMYMPTRKAGNVTFQPLLGNARYISSSFVASESYSADKAYLWIRRNGSPGTLTLRIHADNSGVPGTVAKTVEVTINDITDYVSLYKAFDWTGTTSLVSGNTYHISVFGAGTDDIDNHWAVGVNASSAASLISSDDSTWTDASFSMYYRVTNADTKRKWYRFYLSDAFYIVDSKDDGTTASVIYINGDRGKATSGGNATITDSAKSWVENRWRDAYVKITGGTGIGQVRQIISNTSTTLTVSEAWLTNPSTDSEFVIYGTEWFTQVSLSGASLGVVTGEPAVANNVAYIPQGTTGIVHMQWNASTKVHDGYSETATGTQGLAHFLRVANDVADGPVIWRANNTSATGSGGNVTVSRANLLSDGSYIAWNTALTFGTSTRTGTSSYRITGLNAVDDTIYVFREDGMGRLSDDRYINIETGIEKTPSEHNGAAAASSSNFLYYSWLHSLIRMYGSSHDDIGDDYRSSGLPSGREGNYSDLEPYLKLLFCAIDAGVTGTSSVLAWDGIGWHEIFRGRQGGRIRMCRVQACPETRNRLWMDVGGDLAFLELPLNRAAPRLDTGARYMHEAVIESSAIDMGTASGLPKFIKDLTITAANLNTQGRRIYVDFQVDDDVHTSNWTYAGVATESPESVIFLGLENVRRFAYRLRITCNDNSVPIDITGVIPNGYARTPFRMVFTMQIQAGGIYTRKGKTASSGELMRWLLDSARQPGRVKMSSVYEMAHGWYVVIHPPRQFPVVPKTGRNPETANLTLVLQEV